MLLQGPIRKLSYPSMLRLVWVDGADNWGIGITVTVTIGCSVLFVRSRDAGLGTGAWSLQFTVYSFKQPQEAASCWPVVDALGARFDAWSIWERWRVWQSSYYLALPAHLRSSVTGTAIASERRRSNESYANQAQILRNSGAAAPNFASLH